MSDERSRQSDTLRAVHVLCYLLLLQITRGRSSDVEAFVSSEDVSSIMDFAGNFAERSVAEKGTDIDVIVAAMESDGWDTPKFDLKDNVIANAGEVIDVEY